MKEKETEEKKEAKHVDPVSGLPRMVLMIDALDDVELDIVVEHAESKAHELREKVEEQRVLVARLEAEVQFYKAEVGVASDLSNRRAPQKPKVRLPGCQTAPSGV